MPLVASRGGAAALGFGFGSPLSGGDFESIATATVASGGTTQIEFTSIPSTYQHLQIRGVMRTEHTNPGPIQLDVRMNGNSSANYAYHVLSGSGSTASAWAAGGATEIGGPWAVMNSSTSSVFSGLVVDILDYASTSKTKTVRSFSGADLNGSGQVAVMSGLWNSTSAITSIAIYHPSAEIFQTSTLALYGIKAP